MLESVDQDFNQQAEKYVDNLTLFEPIYVVRPGLIEDDGCVSYEASSSQRSLEKMKKNAYRRG